MIAKPSYQHLETPLLKGARYDLFSVFLCVEQAHFVGKKID